MSESLPRPMKRCLTSLSSFHRSNIRRLQTSIAKACACNKLGCLFPYSSRNEPVSTTSEKKKNDSSHSGCKKKDENPKTPSRCKTRRDHCDVDANDQNSVIIESQLLNENLTITESDDAHVQLDTNQTLSSSSWDLASEISLSDHLSLKSDYDEALVCSDKESVTSISSGMNCQLSVKSYKDYVGKYSTLDRIKEHSNSNFEIKSSCSSCENVNSKSSQIVSENKHDCIFGTHSEMGKNNEFENFSTKVTPINMEVMDDLDYFYKQKKTSNVYNYLVNEGIESINVSLPEIVQCSDYHDRKNDCIITEIDHPQKNYEDQITQNSVKEKVFGSGENFTSNEAGLKVNTDSNQHYIFDNAKKNNFEFVSDNKILDYNMDNGSHKYNEFFSFNQRPESQDSGIGQILMTPKLHKEYVYQSQPYSDDFKPDYELNIKVSSDISKNIYDQNEFDFISDKSFPNIQEVESHIYNSEKTLIIEKSSQ
ncbi:unnamed protein product, partial [Meganyctiphanes norvegica]